MAKHVHIHFHDSFEESKHPRGEGGKFGHGGSGHNETSKHPTVAGAHSAVKERREGLEGSGFKHEKTEGEPDDVGGQKHHLVHPNGSRALITHKQEAVSGRHSVSSYVNTTKKK